MKKYIAVVILNILILAGITIHFGKARPSVEPLSYRFTFVCPLLWDSVAGGIKQADERLGTDTKCIGFKNLNEEAQAKAIDQAVFARVDGIITAGNGDSRLVAEAIERAGEEGIPVVLVDSDIPDSERTCYIGPDHQRAGEMAGEDMVEATGGQAHIGIIVSELEDEDQKKRLEGFCSVIGEEKGMEVVKILESESDRMRIRKLEQQMLRENPEINAIYCADETAADMLGETLEKEGYLSTEIKVVCFGMSESIWEYIQKGRYYSSIVQESFENGQQAVAFLKEYLNEKKEGTELIYTGLQSAGKDYDFESWKNKQQQREVVWRVS